MPVSNLPLCATQVRWLAPAASTAMHAIVRGGKSALTPRAKQQPALHTPTSPIIMYSA
jgi:hypothetical protein